MRPLKEKISITVDEPVVRELRRLAEGEDRSLSQYINRVLKWHVQEVQGSNRKKK